MIHCENPSAGGDADTDTAEREKYVHVRKVTNGFLKKRKKLNYGQKPGGTMPF